jgi:hypothetical protein
MSFIYDIKAVIARSPGNDGLVHKYHDRKKYGY